MKMQEQGENVTGAEVCVTGAEGICDGREYVTGEHAGAEGKWEGRECVRGERGGAGGGRGG